MKKIISAIILLLSLTLTMNITAFAHSGRTDANGGHYNRKTGEYHYHNGGTSSGSSSSSSSNYSSSYSSSSSETQTTTAPPKVYATEVKVKNMPKSIDAGESVKLEGYAYPTDAEDQDISWSSNNTDVATVDSSGNLEAVGVGTAVISAKTSKGTTSKFTITVKEVEAKKIVINGKQSELLINDTICLSVDFSPENTTNKEVEWISDDENIAYIDSTGELTAMSVGTTTITAKHNKITDSFELEVKPIEAENIEIECYDENDNLISDNLKFKTNTQINLNADVLPSDTTDKSVVWSVDNASVAQIDDTGKLTGIHSGNVIVTATSSNGITDTIEIEFYNDYTVVIVSCIVISVLVIVVVIYIIRKRKSNS